MPHDDRARPSPRRPRRPIGTTRWRRLVLGQTAIDFWGRGCVWLGHLAGRCSSISVVSLVRQRGLELGIDFEGGVAWDVPAGELTVDDARSVLDDNGIDERRRPRSRSATPTAATSSRSRSSDQPEEVRVAAAGGVRRGRRRRPPPTSAWRRSAPRGAEEITRKAVIGAGRLPRPDRPVHLVPLRVADGADRACWR